MPPTSEELAEQEAESKEWQENYNRLLSQFGQQSCDGATKHQPPPTRPPTDATVDFVTSSDGQTAANAPDRGTDPQKQPSVNWGAIAGFVLAALAFISFIVYQLPKG